MGWKPDICLYHGHCDDGFGAAWVVRKRFGEGVTFVAGHYSGFKWPCDIKGKNILMVDFSMKRDKMIELANGGLVGQIPKSIIVLDHHKTAEAELKQWDIGPVASHSLANAEANAAVSEMEQAYPIVAHFDMNRSGARLAWDFCFPGDPVPRLIEHIEDRDLWRFALHNTKKVSAALRTYPHDFVVWDWLDPSKLKYEGVAILRGHEKNVRVFCENRYWAYVGGVYAPVVNVPYHYASDCANAILALEPDAPFAAAWFRRGDGKVGFSLRSENGRADVSEIAKSMGGGGHRNSAGFETSSWSI